jgi:CheY-like chemotaxis protein
LREFSRLRDEALELAPVSLPEVIQHAIALTRSSWQDTAYRSGAVIDVRTELEADVPAVLGAESEIRDAVVNLILNAVDAMPRGGTLTLRTRRRRAADDQGELLALEVEDTGSGMSDETRRRCLEPFFSTKGKRGTGLGLAMAFGTMQRHGGELEIDSQLGRGTLVRLLFRAPAAGPAAAAERSERRPSRRLQVLIVDDDPLVLRTLRELMVADGHLVTAADGGQAGINAFQAALAVGERFDVVMTDLGMPYVDGRRVAAAIKSAAPEVPIILLTGWGQDAEVRGDASLRADRVIGKPPRLVQLRNALAELTDVKR